MKLVKDGIKHSRIEMLPLIDSFFLILVYFIYAFLSMSVHKGIPLDLPIASTAVEEKEEKYGISVTKEGEIFFNDQRIQKEQLKTKISALAEDYSALQFHIYGDKQANHGDVIYVLDTLRSLGINKVYIETDHNG